MSTETTADVSPSEKVSPEPSENITRNITRVADPTRRGLFGAGAGLLLLTTPSAGGAKAAEHDGQLLALAAELQAVDEQIGGYDHDAPGSSWEAFEALQGDYWRVFEKLDGIPARTAEGIQAKARIARSLIAGGGIDRDSATGRHIEGLLADLLGEA